MSGKIERDPTLISRRGERDGTLRVDACVYGIDIKLFGEMTYGLDLEQAKTLLERLSSAIEDVENTDAINWMAAQPTADSDADRDRGTP